MSDHLDNVLGVASRDIEKELFVKLSESNSKNEYDCFCVLEGFSDTVFYSNVNHPFFKENSIDFIYGHFGDISKNIVGKFSVVKSCEYALEKFSEKFKKCVFIVDHDYFGLDEYRKRFSKMCLEAITVLPVYSFENYFFIAENLDYIISRLFPEELHDEFKKLFDEFCKRFVEYCKFKAVLTKHHDEIKYYNLHRDEEIFFFNFQNGVGFDYKMMENEIENMKSCLSQYPNYLKSAEYIERKMMEGKKLIKGKIVFNFIRLFLLHKVYNDSLYSDSNEYPEIVNNLKIDIEIKNYKFV